MADRFSNRRESGKHLAQVLTAYKDRAKGIVLALPRGGVPVAFEVARALGWPLDLMLVRKLGVPGDEELAMGAVAINGVSLLNEDIIGHLNISKETVDAVMARETEELNRRNEAYRDGRPAPEIQGRTVILVDDGMATGADMRGGDGRCGKTPPFWSWPCR